METPVPDPPVADRYGASAPSMSGSKKVFIIIDGNALLHRAWHALPPLQTKSGIIVNAVYGFLMILLKALADLKPAYIAVAFDTKAPTFRDEAYAAYKAQRVKQPQELYDQIPILKNVLAAFHVPVYEKDGFEADDVIGTIVSYTQRPVLCATENGSPEIEKIIVTGDLDTLQLVDEHTKVMTLRKGITDTVVYDAAVVDERFGLAPAQMIDYKALRGDPSDNIPGVKGIGEKTAQELLQKFGSVDAIYKKLENRDWRLEIRGRIGDMLLKQKEEAELSKKLVTIVRDVPIDFNLEQCRWKGIDEPRVVELFQELGFKSLLARLPHGTQRAMPPSGGTPPKAAAGDSQRAASSQPPLASLARGGERAANYVLVDTQEKFNNFLGELSEQQVFTFDTETDNVNPLRATLVGISFSWETGKAYYIPSSIIARSPAPEQVRYGVDSVTKQSHREIAALPSVARNDGLGEILEDPKIKKVAHNAKFDIEALTANGIRVRGLAFDTMIASYLLNPGSRQHGLDRLAFEEFGFRMTPIEELIGKGKNEITMDKVPLEKIVPYACADADYTWRLYEKLTKELKDRGTEKLFRDIEMPLVPVLIAMETAGVKIDTAHLAALAKDVGARLEKLAERIHALAGSDFNIQSPMQLKEILFEKLQISTKGIGKTKTGLSTAAEELEKLKGVHPIIEPIIEYRELAKLQSTYLEALPALVDAKDGRLHTSFNQTVTATGRLSSSDPNLQNIPVRTELGNEIRKAFIAEKGNVILAADYSQIELRVAAHLSGDAKMIAAFKNGEDFHSRTAAEIHDVPIDEVTKDMRRDAKTINFGILYGMGSQSLAQSTGMSRDAARAFIEKYFVVYKQLAAWIEETKALAKALGYVETLFGRRRYLPEINSGVPMVRAAAERMAVNMPVQGTAADIMKMAMIHIDVQIANGKSQMGIGNRQFAIGDVRMLLQVHDELVFEVVKDAVGETARMVRDTMESIVKLKVPLKADIKVGPSWGELRPLT